MSVQQISKALDLGGVSQAEKLLLIVLANYADENGRCWPSQATLSQKTCMSDRSIRTAFVRLEGLGLIIRERRTRKDGSRTSDMIQLCLDAQTEDDGGDLPENISGPTGKSRQSYRKNLPVLPENISGLTSYEPSDDPSFYPSDKRARDFERFWQAYPEKKGKRAAEAAFAKAIKRGTIDQMLWAIDDAKANSRKWLEGFIPNPTTWLNQDRWNDEHSTRSIPSRKLVERHENMRRALSGFATAADPRDDDG